MIFFVSLLFHQFFYPLLQFFTSEIFGYDVSFIVDEDIGRDGADVVGRCSSTLPAFKVAHLWPRHLQSIDGLDPRLVVVVERDAYDLQSFAMIQVVYFHHVGHLRTAGAAPAGPKVEKCIAVLIHIVGQADISLGISAF